MSSPTTQRNTMKSKSAASLIALIVTTFGLGAFALDNSDTTRRAVRNEVSDDHPRIFVLKSNGKPVAELKALPGTELSISGGHSDLDIRTGRLTCGGGVVLNIGTGTNSVSVTADEIESVPTDK